MGPKLAEHAGGDFIGGAMGAIDDQFQSSEIGAAWHTALAELDITTCSVVDARHLTELSRLDDSHRLIQQFLDHRLDFIR